MKKNIFLLLTALVTAQLLTAQNKNYISIDAGGSITGMSKQLINHMKADGFGDKIDNSFWFFYIPINTSSQYPQKKTDNSSFRIRYGYNFAAGKSIEAGFAGSIETMVKGADSRGDNVNYITIASKISTVYVAYMWKNAKKNAAIGVGPAVSICNIKQESINAVPAVSNNKTHVLPGAIFTGYWNFVNNKIWFMGLRSDMTLTVPAKTATMQVTNGRDNSFTSLSTSTGIGAVITTFSISAGIKF